MQVRRFVSIVISLFLGGVFIFSAYSKLYPIEPFEFTFVDLGISTWSLSPFFARSIIGFEFLLGLLFIFQIGVTRITSKLSIGLLAFFSLYLVFFVIKNGNNSNCGCFGEMLPMTPYQSILKNIILLCLNIYLVKRGTQIEFSKTILGVSVTISLLLSAALPYILNPIDLDYSKSYLSSKESNYFMPLDTLIQKSTIHSVDTTIKHKKMIIAFLSSSCAHCKIAGAKLRIIKEKNETLPLLFVMNGDNKDILAFQEYTKSQNIKWTKLSGKSFMYLAGLNLPKVALINNQIVEHELNYFELDQTEIENWVKK